MDHEAPRVYALHGGGTTPALWNPLRRVVPDLPIVAPDLNRIARDIGEAPSYEQVVDALLEQAPPGPLVLLGATMGARFAVSVGARLGDRLRAMLLLMPLDADEDASFLAKFAGLRRFLVEGFSESYRETVIPVMLHRWGPRFAEASQELRQILTEGAGATAAALSHASSVLDEPAAIQLRRIAASVEVLFGAADPVFEPSLANSWRRLPAVRSVEILPEVSHQIALEVPQRIAADLRRLLAR